MADTHLQVNSDASLVSRKTTLWPSGESERKQILTSIFEQKNWTVSNIEHINGSFWKVETFCQNISYKINLYISSIRDEARQNDEFKMQLGNSYPEEDEPGWITLIWGIYSIDDGNAPIEYILSAYNRSSFKFETNPSIRGTRTTGLQKALIMGYYKTDKSILFRPDFIYYFIENQDLLYGGGLSSSVISSSSTQPLSTLNPASLSSFNQQLLSAVKTKPFVLLAGISGTGKSRIVRELAKACWDNDEDRKKLRNFKMIQVRPNWHDSSEVLGYVSRISGEEYIIGDFLRAVAEAWQDTSRPYFVCLDEMNLAPVEQYFAEYLSVFESRRFEDGDWKTDCIVPMQVEQWYVDMVHKLVGDNENLNDQFLNQGISIPPNLVVIGTVNMDETTYSFSRKVLDRAMTIEMNDVDLKAGISGNPKENDFSGILLSEGDVLAPKMSVDDMISDNPEVCDRVVEYLSDINAILAKTPFRIAFRTRNEAILYVLNMLDLRKDEIAGDEGKKDEIIASALDEITMMKILSRIEGDESKISKEKLGKLREKAGKKCKDKLDYMIARLDSGFTSFWE